VGVGKYLGKSKQPPGKHHLHGKYPGKYLASGTCWPSLVVGRKKHADVGVPAPSFIRLGRCCVPYVVQASQFVGVSDFHASSILDGSTTTWKVEIMQTNVDHAEPTSTGFWILVQGNVQVSSSATLDHISLGCGQSKQCSSGSIIMADIASLWATTTSACLQVN